MKDHLPLLKGGIEGKAAQRYLVSLIPLSEHFAGATLNDIGSAMLSEFESKRRRQGVTTGTIRNDLWCLSSVFTCAKEWEWVPDNGPALHQGARQARHASTLRAKDTLSEP